MQIGFVGLGNMGAPMARNLAAAGHGVAGFDVAGVTIEGVTPAASAAAAAEAVEVVITMLPDGPILRRVAADLLPAMAGGATLLDCSTVDVDSARAVAVDCETRGLTFVDAPVSGGIGGAQAGTLTFMAGGTDAGFARGRRGPGGKDLQQYDPGDFDDRRVRGVWPGRKTGPGRAGDV